ncbi:MAG: polysaccharide deacetylase family protein [Clostridia bacterium]|nr:polysaccharide deacetylase family protein [Clostridia bacterium]
MNKLKTRIITNSILIILVAVVFTFTIIPSNSIMIYGKDSNAVLYNGNRNSNEVSLMFNVYENGDVVNGILDLLKEKNVKATFFIGGIFASRECEVIKRIYEEGHELGNHGYFHKDHKKLTESQNVDEILSTHRLVKSITGIEMNLFAPPSGAYSKTTLKVAESLKYKTIMWSKDTIDWRDSDVKTIIKRATENTVSGDLILMHPKGHTLTALSQIIETLSKKGLKMVTVSKCCQLESI